jgi:hypothetical protein
MRSTRFSNSPTNGIQILLKEVSVPRYGHASKGRGDTRLNNEIRSSLSRKRITVSLNMSQPRRNRFAEALEIEEREKRENANSLQLPL